MKILYYTDQTYKHGGIERVLSNKINYLVEQADYKIYLLTTEQKGNPHCYKISNKLIHSDLGINYHRDLSYFHPKNSIKVLKHFFKLYVFLKKTDPDIVITPHMDYAHYFLPFIHQKSKKIREYHGSRYFEGINRSKQNALHRKIMYVFKDYIESKYDQIVVLTPDEQQHFKSNNTRVIPNGITSPFEGGTGGVSPLLWRGLGGGLFPSFGGGQGEATSPLEGGLRGVSPSKTMLSAGRIAPVKGYEKLITAWAKVHQKHPEWQLEIYGSGEKAYVNSLQKQIDELALQDRICLCGQTGQLMEKMQKSQAYVMSSQTECFPMVLLEAQTVGLPIVSFDCPYGPKNIINNNQDGLLVENQNSDKLAEAINQLIENPDIRKQMGKQAQINVQKLDQENIMQQWINLFKRLTD